MKHFLLEGHRPDVPWEKQTRVVEAPSFSAACKDAESVRPLGIVLTLAQDLGEDFNPASIRQYNPFLFTPWDTREIPKS